MINPDYIQELFAAFGPVSVRRMFGGAGVWADGLMIAIVNDGAIFLKTDAESSAAFAREGCKPFAYTKKDGEHRLTSYWRVTDRLYDDPEELAVWARAALRVAQTKHASKSAPARRRPRRGAKASA
jgi:DNA transformation protein